MHYHIETYDTVTSTFDVLRERRDEPEGLAIIATEQTAGIGQRGKAFFSPSGTGLYLGILLKPAEHDIDETRITLMTAQAVCHAIEAIAPDQKPEIKLPNDVLIDGRKVCGILAQGLPRTPEHDPCVTLGIGLNVYEPRDGFPPEIADKAAALFKATHRTTSQPDMREQLAAAILHEFDKLYTV